MRAVGTPLRVEIGLGFYLRPARRGKLTVGKELAALTGFKLFHNHLSLNLVRAVFDWDAASFWPLVHGIRRSVIEAAAREGTDLIYTFVYAVEADYELVEEWFALVEGHGGRVCPVQRVCDLEVLDERVQLPERAELGKLISLEGSRTMRQQFRIFDAIPGRAGLKIDNTKLTPAQAAQRIVKHYGLPAIDA